MELNEARAKVISLQEEQQRSDDLSTDSTSVLLDRSQLLHQLATRHKDIHLELVKSRNKVIVLQKEIIELGKNAGDNQQMHYPVDGIREERKDDRRYAVSRVRKSVADALEEQAEKNSREMEEVLKAVDSEFLERIDSALTILQNACELEKASDIRLVKEEYEVKLLVIQKTIVNIENEKRHLESKLYEASCVAEENNDTMYDLHQATNDAKTIFF